MLAEDVVPTNDEVGFCQLFEMIVSASYHSVSASGSSTGTLIGIFISSCNFKIRLNTQWLLRQLLGVHVKKCLKCFPGFNWATVVSALYETTRDLALEAPNFTSGWALCSTQLLPLALQNNQGYSNLKMWKRRMR